MNQQAILSTHKGAFRVTRDDLTTIQTPVPEGIWKPISHDNLVSALHTQLHEHQLSVTKEQYAISKNTLWLFGTMELSNIVNNEFITCLGFRHSNDKSLALRVVAGVRVFVCDNLVLSGEEQVLKRKHTKNFNLEEGLYNALERYKVQSEQLLEKIDILKRTQVSMDLAKAKMCDCVLKGIIPANMLKHVANSYINSEEFSERTLWSLHNAFTLVMKDLPIKSLYRRTVLLGKFFNM